MGFDPAAAAGERVYKVVHQGHVFALELGELTVDRRNEFFVGKGEVRSDPGGHVGPQGLNGIKVG
jgi:hypothetical protein